MAARFCRICQSTALQNQRKIFIGMENGIEQYECAKHHEKKKPHKEGHLNNAEMNKALSRIAPTAQYNPKRRSCGPAEITPEAKAKLFKEKRALVAAISDKIDQRRAQSK